MQSLYPFPGKIGFLLLLDAVLLRKRSFHEDAKKTIHLLTPPPLILNAENVPIQGPCLLVMNHYSQPGFNSWWIALGIAFVIPTEIHWLMTSAWTFPNKHFMRPFIPLTYWLFSRIARVYNFTNLPPMPPVVSWASRG